MRTLYDNKVFTGRDGDMRINVESVCDKKFTREFGKELNKKTLTVESVFLGWGSC